jgi:AAA domain
MERERARREALRRLEAEARGPVTPPVLETLRERLARPRLASRWRIQNWQPQHSRVMIAAQFKTGKTTLVGNLTRSLVDDDRWLGREAVTPITEGGTLAILDFEMSEQKGLDWLGDQRIQHTDRVIPISMRGQALSFDILDRGVRAEWAARFRERRVEYVVLDCLRPVLDTLGLDEHKDAGRFLVAFDALLLDAGVGDALVVHHMGHVNERARGDSRLRDWPDVEWRLVRQDENPASARFLSAYGRDVDVPEAQLSYDGLTRALTLVGGTRADAKTTEALGAVLDVLRADAPLTGRAIKQALSESSYPRDTIDQALRTGIAAGTLAVHKGARNSKLYRIAISQCPGVSGECPADTESECPAAYIEPDTRTLDREHATRVNGPDTETPRETAPYGVSPPAWPRRRVN